MNFRLGNIPIRIRPEFFIIPAYGAVGSGELEKGLIWVAIVFFSVLGHELGHATAMRLFGFAPRIELHAMGGWTLWPSGSQPTERQKLLVTLAGPGIELLVGAAVFLFLRGLPMHPLAEWAVDAFWLVNIVWALVNLAPVLPWDGGLVLDSGVTLITGRRRARGVGLVSMLFGAAAIGAYFWRGSGIMLIYFGGVGIWKGWQRWSGSEPGQVPPEADQAWKLHEQGQDPEAQALLEQTLAKTTDGGVRGVLHEMLAWVRMAQGDVPGAERALRDMGELAEKASPELRARLAAHRQESQRVVDLLAPFAAAQQLRPEAWPLLVSAMDDDARRDELIAASVKRLEQNASEVPSVLAAADKLFYGGHIEAARVMCERAFEVRQHPVFAYNVACCSCRLGRPDDGIAWLKKAVDQGYRSPVSLDADPDLEAVRGRPEYPALRDAAKTDKA